MMGGGGGGVNPDLVQSRRDGAGMAQGWRIGESAHLPPIWPGFVSGPAPYVSYVFAVGSRPAPSVFHWVLRFSSLHKTSTSSNSISTRIEDLYEHQLKLRWRFLSKYQNGQNRIPYL